MLNLENRHNMIFYLLFLANHTIRTTHAEPEVKPMNQGPTTQERRSIKVKNFVEDFHSGAGDEELMDKYHLTPVALEKFYTMLIERNILHPDDFEGRVADEAHEEPTEAPPRGDTPKFFCPACLAAQERVYDTCPDCGASIRDLVKRGATTEYDSGSGSGPEMRYPQTDPDFEPRQQRGLEQRPGRASNAAAKPGPIELPLHGPVDDEFFPTPDRERDTDHFGGHQEFKKLYEPFHDTMDQVIPGMPLDYIDSEEPEDATETVRCVQCEAILDARVRRTFDRKGSLLGLILSGLFMVIGLTGAVSLTLFQPYSIFRLVMIYFTGMSMLLGGSLMALAIFMLFLAHERVYLCHRCGSVYPRA